VSGNALAVRADNDDGCGLRFGFAIDRLLLSRACRLQAEACARCDHGLISVLGDGILL
jgi:hypothetical protein